MPSGVYLIRNRLNGRRYVGSAVNIEKRWREHLRQLTAGKHHSRFLQRCWDKHGEEAFEFVVIVECERALLIETEQRFIDELRPEYNSSPTAGSQLGYKHTPETKRKLADAARRTRNFTGRRHSDETKARISESRKGKGGGPRSPERLAKISAAMKGRRISPHTRAKISETLTGRSTGRGSLTPDQVRMVRELGAQGMGRCRVAKALSISEHAADAVLGGHAYLWVN